MHHEPTLFCSLAGGADREAFVPEQPWALCRRLRTQGFGAGGRRHRPNLAFRWRPKRATQIFSKGSIGKRSLQFLRPAKNLMPTLITGDFESANSASGSL